MENIKVKQRRRVDGGKSNKQYRKKTTLEPQNNHRVQVNLKII